MRLDAREVAERLTWGSILSEEVTLEVAGRPDQPVRAVRVSPESIEPDSDLGARFVNVRNGFAFRRADVADGVPVGAVVVDDCGKRWRVDSAQLDEETHVRVVVVPEAT